MQTAKKPTWSKAISQPAREFPITNLKIISGKIPPGLRGTLYRNGSARLERGGIHVGHWFDGDGAILAVHFHPDGSATGVYRYVQTQGYQAESQAGKLLYSNYGMTAPGAVWNNWFKPVKNAANTSVLALPDKLLALWEGGKPHYLDLQELNTLGEDNLGELTDKTPYSAHPKVDGMTGEIFNFGITPGKNATLNVYRSNMSGNIKQKNAHKLDGTPLVHDFVLAGQYLVFVISPVQLQLLPALIGFKSFSEAMTWEPELGTQILVIDRQTLEIVSRIQTEPWYQWHFANGYVDDSGIIIIDIAKYSDFQTNQYLKEFATGQTHTLATSSLSRVHINPQKGEVTQISELLDRHCEFPSVPPQHVGQKSDYTYLSIAQPGTDMSKEILNGIACLDHNTETLTEANIGTDIYPSEPIYVNDADDPNQGWVLTVIFDGSSECSEVWIFNTQKLDEEPTCKLGLPSIIPPGFHGTWTSFV
ncbi:MAG: carotenoid oxygenase family protein [Cyanobacteria bacterium P01_A01_bin.84]